MDANASADFGPFPNRPPLPTVARACDSPVDPPHADIVTMVATVTVSVMTVTTAATDGRVTPRCR